MAADHVDVVSWFLELPVLGILLHLNSLDVHVVLNVYQFNIPLQVFLVFLLLINLGIMDLVFRIMLSPKLLESGGCRRDDVVLLALSSLIL